MSELEDIFKQKQQIPFKDAPPIFKRIAVEITDTITDIEILAVVSAFIELDRSSKIKHTSLCMQKHIKQTMEFAIDIKCPESIVDKGLEGLLSNLLTCKFTFNSDAYKSHDYNQILIKDDIYKLALPSGRAFAQAVGILIGSEANAVFDLMPHIKALGITKQFDNLVTVHSVLNFSYVSDEISTFAKDHNYSIEVLTHEDDSNMFTFNEKLQQVINSALVLGPPSFYTYAAACLEIPCIEIFDNQSELNVLSKWSCFKYAAILKDEAKHFKASRLETAWKHWLGQDVNKQNIVLPSDG